MVRIWLARVWRAQAIIAAVHSNESLSTRFDLPSSGSNWTSHVRSLGYRRFRRRQRTIRPEPRTPPSRQPASVAGICPFPAMR
jgi:hypothetical protein